MTIALKSEVEGNNFPVSEEDDLPESELQDTLLLHLVLVLKQLFRAEGWYVARNLAVFPAGDAAERPQAPDISVFIGVPYSSLDWYVKSWTVAPPLKPAPRVVFEAISDESMLADLTFKPEKYALMGVQEYFAYDPRPFPVGGRRLWGWISEAGSPHELAAGEDGRIWSRELNCWLVPDDRLLRLYSADDRRHLTGEEHERAGKQECTDGKPQCTGIEQERAAKERAWALLRELGIDPEAV